MSRFTDISPLVAGHEGFFSQIANIGLDHKKRVDRYKSYWDFYEGKHWNVVDHDNVTTNYIRRLVNLKCDFLTKNSFYVSIPELPNSLDDSIDRNFIKNILDDQWSLNEKDVWFRDLAQMGGVTGDAFVRVGWERSPSGGMFAMANIIPSHFVFPEFDVLHPKRMVTCHIIWPSVTRSSRNNASTKRPWGGVGNDTVTWFRETWTETEVVVLENDKILKREPNVLGEIPVVHIKNVNNTNSYYGVSDVEDLISVQMTYNETLTDINDIIEYHGSPITHVKGGRLEEVNKGPDQVWSTSKDVEIKNIGLDSDLKANISFLHELYRAILDLSSVPEQAVNPTKNVSNTPGVALHMAYLPLIENRRKKILNYGQGIKHINRLMLKTLELGEPDFGSRMDQVKTYKYRTDLSFGEPLPRDEVQELEKKRTLLNMGLTTRKRVLMREGKSAEDSERIIEEADAELERLTEIRLLKPMVQTRVSDAFGKARSPDPVIQGDKVSNQSTF